MGSQIDIVDHLRSFACKTLLQPCFTFDNKSFTQTKREEMDNSTYNEITKVRWTSGSPNKKQKNDLLECQELINHSDFCMQKFSTYFMVGHKEIDQCEVVGVAIIENDVQMSSLSNRSLINFYWSTQIFVFSILVLQC